MGVIVMKFLSITNDLYAGLDFTMTEWLVLMFWNYHDRYFSLVLFVLP